MPLVEIGSAHKGLLHGKTRNVLASHAGVLSDPAGFGLTRSPEHIDKRDGLYYVGIRYHLQGIDRRAEMVALPVQNALRIQWGDSRVLTGEGDSLAVTVRDVTDVFFQEKGPDGRPTAVIAGRMKGVNARLRVWRNGFYLCDPH